MRRCVNGEENNQNAYMSTKEMSDKRPVRASSQETQNIQHKCATKAKINEPRTDIRMPLPKVTNKLHTKNW